MGLRQVKEYFQSFAIADRIQEFPVSSATVELAAQALQTEPERIAKTLSFLVDQQVVLIVMAGDQKIDNAKFKQQFHQKAKMISAEDVESLTGHPIGGVCPFAVLENVKVYLDVSLKRFSTVFPACGSPNSAIALSIPELERYSKFLEWIDVGKKKEAVFF